MKHSLDRRTIDGERLDSFFAAVKQSGIRLEETVFLCIGTDRSTGDSFGPLVGTLLRQAGYPYVQGTLEQPCDANTLLQHLKAIPPGKVLIAIDACLGRDAASVGRFQVARGPIEPGKSMGSRLPGVGDFSIAGIVNRNEGQAYRMLQTTSLYLVMKMATELVSSVKREFPLGAEIVAGREPGSPLRSCSTPSAELTLPLFQAEE